MLIDTHCHINMMVKKEFDRALSADELAAAKTIVDEAYLDEVTCIINVGTSLVESINGLWLAESYHSIYAAVGIHPNDLTSNWHDDLKQLLPYIKDVRKNKIVAIGECGLDRHYPDYNKQQQYDAFKAQIELVLEYDLALIVHTRDAGEETLRSLEEFKGQITRGVIHCFSEDQYFADEVINMGFVIGIGGTLTYLKNDTLRSIAKNVSLDKIVLETDAPFLPPQSMRGQQNHPRQIATIAQYLAELREESFEQIAQQTTENARELFALPSAG